VDVSGPHFQIGLPSILLIDKFITRPMVWTQQSTFEAVALEAVTFKTVTLEAVIFEAVALEAVAFEAVALEAVTYVAVPP
jgi:hypothetical protein